MDLFNNQVGRDLYLYLLSQGLTGDFYKESLILTLIQKISNGDLRKLDPLDSSDQIIPGITQLVPTN